MLLDDKGEFPEHTDLEIAAKDPPTQTTFIHECELALLQDIVTEERMVRWGWLDDLNQLVLAHLVLVLGQNILQLVFWSLIRNNWNVDFMETILGKYLRDEVWYGRSLDILIIHWVDAVFAGEVITVDCSWYNSVDLNEKWQVEPSFQLVVKEFIVDSYEFVSFPVVNNTGPNSEDIVWNKRKLWARTDKWIDDIGSQISFKVANVELKHKCLNGSAQLVILVHVNFLYQILWILVTEKTSVGNCLKEEITHVLVNGFALAV